MTRWLARFAIIGLGLGTLRASPSQAQWVERPGTGWVQVQAVYHRTNTRFGPEGSIEPLFNEGSRSITTSVFLTTAIGLVPGLDAWAQLPAHRLQFNDVVRDRTSTGLGDPRLFLRASLQAFGLDLRVPIAVRGGVKLPVGDFPIDAEVIPLSEGQRDWELLVELGHSFYPAPVYVMGWAGYRWRETNEAIARKPGDEWLAYVAAGGTVRDLTWKIAVDGLFGRPPVRRLPSGLAIELEQDVRRLVQVLPSVGWRVGPGALEVGARLPLTGRNLPAGPAFTAGYFFTWDDALW